MSGYSAIVHILAIASIVGVCANVVAVETGAPVLVPAPREMVVHEGGCPRGWSILTSDADIGYYLSRLGLIISFH